MNSDAHTNEPDSGNAGVDVTALMAEVRAEVERKRALGMYPPEVLDDMDQSQDFGHSSDAIRAGLSGLRRTYPFSMEAPITASRPALAPVIASTKRAIKRGIGWYIASIVDQLNNFASQVVRLLDQVADQSSRIEQRLTSLEEQVGDLQSRLPKEAE